MFLKPEWALDYNSSVHVMRHLVKVNYSFIHIAKAGKWGQKTKCALNGKHDLVSTKQVL